jgi:PHD/YefM family antitoxin component YafN of YafNO toxin-antitoxin module
MAHIHETFESFVGSAIMRVSSAEFLKRYGPLSDQALTEPVTITRNGRDRLVLVSAQEFERLRRYAPRARRIEELTDGELTAIAEAGMSPEHDHLNALLDD